MRPDFIFRSGKYQGKTYSYVRRVDPRWLSWVEANRPEMLKEHGQPRSLDTQVGGNPRKLDTQNEGWEWGKRKFEDPPDLPSRYDIKSSMSWGNLPEDSD